ncbi:bifunctional alpha,alpha-trehalose-phosphate synthase (UDP-forming)/trehalose-phosphatase [Acanthopleuribacter pedis]|uniref:Bifunctional alpha,alpha-trehalose-phosphate synthase (UDP-forming)/trehalose-phosphatase n=1 Tax=Acanthopleuribacter pedis TaxID=442870 RepID=A0A8J7QNN4_9BACT|nr:bifunctional alpha,alpha-trehalose-phosphate synthase (UDP-forming)/trehalose-phosphatase [Acanthopleuribacter pedis]MBO1321758.1 bifunctional alpha,alpha-trehalose-phosphate synthase (UDP-forming)/trehalose-phosphatase [Acanthopleuribacter pedis]
MTKKRRILIISNRLPITVKEENGTFDVRPSAGGLVAGLRGIHQNDNDDTWWIGHGGVFGDDPFTRLRRELEPRKLVPVPIDQTTYDGYYNGMANNVIWPQFHYFPSMMHYQPRNWEAFEQANRAFADTALEVAKPGDWIWVHDYQLMLVPQMLRERAPNLRISYFHHIPFPSSEIFRTLPNRVALLRGLLGADLIGFHTYDYVRHFISSAVRLLGKDVYLDEITHGDRMVKVGAFPLGVDCESINAVCEELDHLAPPQQPFQELNAPLVMLGIDRLDYTKGIPERLEAFGRFLRKNPDYIGKAVLVQLCVPSRQKIPSYGELRARVERLVGQLNGEFGKPGYTPIHYLYQSFSQKDVVALYRKAQIALVTPLRDGLNLVCKEFVAAHTDEDGVVILSELAGAATEMGEALSVNPFDVEDMAAAMLRAATMEPAERQSRMRGLRKRILEFDNYVWCQTFLDSWANITETRADKSVKLEPHAFADFTEQLRKARRVFLFLDNDGTLTPIAARPELAIPPREVVELLRQFGLFGKMHVNIVTGRPREYCETYFGDLPLNLITEHGIFMRSRGEFEWESLIDLEDYTSTRTEVKRLFDMFVRFVPGSHIEEKIACLVLHYRQAEPLFAESQAKLLIETLHALLGKTTLSVFPGKKTVEVRPLVADKGQAVEMVLTRHDFDPDQDVFFTIGDDTTDEFMYKIHPNNNFSIHVGKPNVHAHYYVEGPVEVALLLKHIHETLASDLAGQSAPEIEDPEPADPVGAADSVGATDA